ncbi:GlxA family transcriptional regulator [Phyllobacterium zundukense]|uniref:DJ-1/PfpI family protein n=1 Tax=Phyllobacterium zundukense TaxID=1867719 RepID=A0ACD4CXD6_9HYPH|nr:DJ-1/PfpI family protein [Phyllobacterium zundukense]UXN58255.1 DJ-1/PfpI family protein [Phyllobacterium zundukense]
MLIEVAILVYPGFELLDASGPASVFGTANFVLVQRQKDPAYEISVVSSTGGAVRSSSGVSVDTKPLSKVPPRKLHTFLVAGAEEEPLREVLKDPIVRERAPRWAEKSNRYGSICAGTFVLAELQLIDGRRVASHWSACRPLAAAYPKVEVDENAIFVEDGNVWTSAGVSTGIDMALAMVANDTCKAIANDVAKRLVLYVRRPGNQSQFSPLLRAQRTAEHPFGDMMDWVHLNLEQKLDVPTLAARTGLSERSFFRKFTEVMDETPARLIESIRLDAARLLLSQGLAIKLTALRVGLPSSRFAKAFERRFGVSPRLYRETHAQSAARAKPAGQGSNPT